jgi:predicted Zn-dependent peptidase
VIERLPCGIDLVSEVMPGVRSVAAGFWVGTGSRDEPASLAGASHFLEHLLFKGTAERSAAAIAESLDEVGGDCNAFTTKEYTSFYIRLLSEHLPLGLDILSDIMRRPALRASDVDAERTVILDEILMHADEPSDLTAQQWQAAMFPGHALGRDTLGTMGTVGDLGTDDIAAFFESHYRPGNIVVSVAGDVDHARVAELIESRFGGVTPGRPPERATPGSVVDPVVVTRRDTEQTHLMLGMRACSRHDEQRWALAVLNHVLGGGLSSRLFQKVREDRGLAYSIWSERAAYHDTGSLAVVVGTAPEHVDEVLSIVSGELELLADRGVTEREMSVAKGNLRADALLACEDSGARMSRLGAALLLHGEVKTVDEVVARIDAVTADEVQEAARVIAAAPRCLAAVGSREPGDFDLEALGLSGHAAA